MGHKFQQNSDIMHDFRDISIFVFCHFSVKFRKFKMATIFGETKNFLKIGMAALQRYPVGQKFHQNCSISHGF